MKLRLMALMAAAALAVAGMSTAARAATAPAARASLTDIENDVMCVACHEPLAVAQSPQAEAERDYIRTLIAHGEDNKQIERNLVAQYGPSVLGRPPAQGFDLTVYVLPPAIVVIGLAILAATLPRWRRRSRAAGSATTATAIAEIDARRLEDELARYGG